MIDTATRICSVALFDDHVLVAFHRADIGRGHAEKLLPFIADLPNKGRADAIAVNIGPGSFTGIRVGVAAAKALGFAWGAPCSGYSCLTMVAAMASPVGNVDAVMTGGHGEYYFQSFTDGQSIGEILSLSPAQAAARSHAPFVAGDMATALCAIRGSGTAYDYLPDARKWALISQLPPLAPNPLYVRPPDAKPAKLT